jgi:hypothetical protein
MRKEFDREWGGLATEVLTGMKEWRLQHPRATWNEIEAALDERLARLRARMLQDAALASAAAEWEGEAEEEQARCPACGQVLKARGVSAERHLQTQGGQGVTLKRSYGICPGCGAELFPPR